MQGGPDGLILSVFRPGDISSKDARYLTYLVQVRGAGLMVAQLRQCCIARHS